jgi:NtrC-family two-component system sensor histidine kinase KinB
MDREILMRSFATGTFELADAKIDHALSFGELAQIVHDFKSPLSVVTLETQLLLGRLDDGKHEDMVAATTRILLNLDYLDRLMQDMIDSCAIDAGQFQVHPRLTDLGKLLESVTARMTSTCDPGRLVLDTPASVLAVIDALRIERVVANFVQNALKYSPDTCHVHVRLESANKTSRISVIDEGPGIDPDDARHVFEAYRRAPSGHAHEGSGLGLYVSKRIVEAHGGRIGVETAPGGDAEFYFELPMR